MKVFIYDEKRLNGPCNLCTQGAKHIIDVELKGYTLYVEEYPYVQRGKNTVKGDLFEVSDKLLAELTVFYEDRGMDGKLCFYDGKSAIIFTSSHSFPEDELKDGDYLKYLEDLYKFEEFKTQVNETT